MNNKLISIAALLAFLAVALGALVAHSLNELLTTEKLNSFEIGVRHQFYHSLALLIIGLNASKLNATALIGKIMLIEIVLFSFSLYLLYIQEIIGINLSILVPITPVGGIFFIVFMAYFIDQKLQEITILIS
tara:strand:- start:1278 stop:1673 length:396 start_codon:yes stop_codon:yes gene_type:complete